MNIFSIVLLGLSTNLDNLYAAMLLGLQKKKLHIYSNIIIALVSGIIAGICAQAGVLLVDSNLGNSANIFGGALIALIGIWTIVSAFLKEEDSLMEVENLNLQQTVIFGGALAINCVPVAFGAGAAGLSPIWIGVIIAIFSFVSMGAGVYFGNKIERTFNGRYINLISGALLILMGIIEMLQGFN